MFRDIIYYLSYLESSALAILFQWNEHHLARPLSMGSQPQELTGGQWGSDVPHRMCRGTTDAEIGKAVFNHHIGIVEVATVDDDGITKGLVQPIKIQGGEFIPVGEDEQNIGVLGCRVGVGYVTKIGSSRKHFLGSLDRCIVIWYSSTEHCS